MIDPVKAPEACMTSPGSRERYYFIEMLYLRQGKNEGHLKCVIYPVYQTQKTNKRELGRCCFSNWPALRMQYKAICFNGAHYNAIGITEPLFQ